DDAQLEQTLIMSYSSKFSSNFYGPFRTAAESTPQHGDRKGYQIDYRNPQDAILSSLRDSKQGADILMVKPAGAYLDILYQIKHHEEMQYFPLAAYQVSGEYQALWAMQKAGLISSFQDTYKETLVAIKRAGADMIITYGANNFKEWFYV
ncbi:MAG: porphobilinogen synthase, partial [Bacteriovoracaceae bacterium]|nr:porphobilinogen synthase [Bacteriovoracaceae bacterium]